MSYLGCPRIHIAGLFFTNPGNLNNLVENYQAKTPEQLDYDTGLYKNPSGVAQLWLEQCVVTSVVGTDGKLCSASSTDSLVGASVLSASPTTPLPDGKGGYRDIAKIVDLDPNMQFRSEVYGLYVDVTIAGGGGFSGLMREPPQLRDLFFGRGNAGIDGLQVAVGNWHQRLTDVVWKDPADPSPVYTALKAGGVSELDLKLAVDMYQTKLANEFTQGNRFGYGRLVGAIGPADVDGPSQLVPGRSLYGSKTPGLSGPSSSAASTSTTSTTTRASGASTRVGGEKASLQAGSDSEVFWSRTDARVQDLEGGQSVLLLDLAGATPLATKQKGRFQVDGTLQVGFYAGEEFTPLSSGDISLSEYFQLDDSTLQIKDCVWPQHSAIAQVALTAAERAKIDSTPLAVRAGSDVMLAENQTGYYINADPATTRLPASTTQPFQLWVYCFGAPQKQLPSGLTLTPQLYVDKDGKAVPTTLFSCELASSATSPGKFDLSLRTGKALTEKEMPKERRSMDSVLCFLAATGDGYVVGETNYQPRGFPPEPPLISLLFWQDLFVVDHPTWEANIEPIMNQYAVLYPGMKSRLDISNLATVTAYRDALIARYRLPRTNQGFMPVVRDMSPATVEMMLQFLDKLNAEQGGQA